MDLLCPNCDSTLTPSVVGYLCVGCGAVHKYYRTPDGTPLDPDIRRKPIDSTTDSESISTNHTNPVDHSSSNSYKTRLRHRLHRLVVPELPSAISQTALSDSDEKLLNPLPDQSVFEPPISHTYSQSVEALPAHATVSQNDSNLPPASPKKPHRIYKIIGLSAVVGLMLAAIAAAGFVSRHSNSPAPSAAVSLPATTQSNAPGSATTAAVDRDNQRKSDLKEISTALEVYKQEKGSYPVGNDISAVYPLQYTNPPYVKFVNYDPSSTDSNKIKYYYQSNGQTFTLKAKLENPADKEAKDGYYVVTSS